MTKTLRIGMIVVLSGCLAAVAAAQGPGAGRGYGRGAGMGFGRGGWDAQWAMGPGAQARVAQVQDPELAARVADLHTQIREKQWALRAAAAAGQETAGLQAEVDALRADLRSTMQSAGLCTDRGVGPAPGQGRGYGYGRGLGMGYGRGFGRGGYGYGHGQGYGQGYGYGYGQGYGRGPCGSGYGWGGACPWR